MTTQTTALEIRLTNPHAFAVTPAGGGPPVFEVDTLTRAVKLRGLLHGDVLMARVPESTYFTLQHMQNLIHSSGWISGGVISDAGGAAIDVAAGTGLIKIADSNVAELQFCDWDALAGTAIPADTTRYVGIEYNDGAPRVSIRTSDTWNENTDFELGVIVNEGGDLHIFQHNFEVGDHASKMIQRLHGVAHIVRDNFIGGLILGESGVNKITMTAGVLWSGLTQYPADSLDTNVAGSFDRFYRDFPTGFIKEATQTDWPNTEYDDGSGALATITGNRYAVLWFYLETDGDVAMLYGRDQYTTQAMAENESVPNTVPDRLATHGVLIGRLIFQKSAVAASEISSVFTTMFAQEGVTAHADLASVTSDQHHVAFVQADADLLYEALGDIATHAALDTGVHGAGGDVLATDADITTHAGVTGAHHTLLHAAAQHNAAALPASANEDLGAFYLDIDDIAVPANPGASIRRLFVNTATGELSVRTPAGATVSLEQGAAFVGAHDILDGAVHTDSAVDGVTRGSLIVGNSSPLWDELVIGAAGTFLRSDAADAVWSAIQDADVPASHSGSAHHASFLQADADLLYEALGDIAIHAALGDEHHTEAHGPAEHTGGGNWKALYLNDVGDESEFVLGAAGTFYRSAGVAIAPAMSAIQDTDVPGVHTGTAHHDEAHAAAEHDAATLPAGFNENLGAFYLDIDDIAVPANPGAGVRRLFVNTATGEISVRTNAGATVSLEGALTAHDHTGAADGGILTNDEHDGYSLFDEIGAPGAPAANKLRVYARDVGGLTALAFVDSAGAEKTLQSRTRSIWMPAGTFISFNSAPTETGVTVANKSVHAWAFDDSLIERVAGQILLPTDWVAGTVTYTIYWIATPTSGAVRWGVHAQAVATDEDPTAVNDISGGITTTVSGTVRGLNKSVSAAHTVSADDMLRVDVVRDGGHLSDTLTGDAWFLGVRVDYTAFF